MNFSVRQSRFYQQYAKNDVEEHVYIFEMCLKWSKYIMLNASDKTWINENDIVKEWSFPDTTCRGNQYKFDSELWLVNA